MIARDNQPAANTDKLACQVERLLFASGFDDTGAARSRGPLHDPRDHGRRIATSQCLCSAVAARHLQRERAARNSENLRARSNSKLDQERAQKSDPHNRDRLLRLDAAAAKNIHRTTQRLAREYFSSCRNAHQAVGAGDVVLGVSSAG